MPIIQDVTEDTAAEPMIRVDPEAKNGKAPKPAKEPKPETKGEVPVEDEGKAESTAGARPAPGHSAVMDRLKKAQDMEVRDWLDQIAGEAPMRAALHRKDPKNFLDPITQQFVKVDGLQTTFDRAVDPEEVQRMFGGGTYQLVVQTRGTDGKWKYFGAKTFEVAGDPNLNSIPRAQKPEPAPTIQIPQKDPAENALLGKMTDFMIGQVRAGQQSSPPQVIHQGLSDAAVQAMIKPLELQIANLTKLLELKDAEISKVRETAGKDPFRDKMLDTLMDGDSARVKALRENFDSELRQLKEGFRQDQERERDRHQRDLERMEKAHEREIASLKASHEQAIALATQKGDITKMVLDREVSTLEKQLDANRTELAQLRAKKEQSIKEKVEELAAIKELVGDEDGEEMGTLEKVIAAVGNLPAVVNMAERAANGGQRPAQQQVAAAPPEQPKIVRNKETGEVHLRKADGSLIPVKKKPVPVTTADGQQFELPPVDPEQVKQAVQFMEGAFRSDTDPKTFAASARPFLSENMLGAIRALGISEFLSKVGKVSAASPLATMRGRQWTKKVAAALLGEEEAPPQPAAPPDDLAQPPAET